MTATAPALTSRLLFCAATFLFLNGVAEISHSAAKFPQEAKQETAKQETAKQETAASMAQESKGIVVIEAESTKSELGKWEKKTDIKGFTGTGYLDFGGNTPTSGPATSPLVYRFKIERGGLYYLHLRCAREKVKNRNDLANDGYVRVEGDYGAGPTPGDKHGDDAPLKMLKKNTKFFGGDDKKFTWASGNRLDPGGHNNKRVAVYNFKAGETYTLVLSGRSQLFKVDRMVFRHKDVAKKVAEAAK